MSDPGNFTVGNFTTVSVAINSPKYSCPKHGIVENVITSHIVGYEGYWCQICWIETLDRDGVLRCQPLPSGFK